MGKLIELIETSRLILRPFNDDDVEEAFHWFSDPCVMRFIPTGPDQSISQTRRRVDSYRKHQVVHGFSKWVIVERESLRLIGDSGLQVLSDYGWIDLGFRLSREFWGKGFASEAAFAWVRAAFEHYGIQDLGAFAHPDNLASLHVLEKIGFRETRRCSVMGMDSVVFFLTPEGQNG
jgi:RimJ/RimL family protein N-acetyltransferase